MNPISSAEDAKCIDRPELTCSIRPWMRSGVSMARSVRWTTKAELADSGAP